MIEKQRLFVDMDGTLAEFRLVDTLEVLYEPGYFLNLLPNENVVAAIKHIMLVHPDIEVYILSAYLSDSKYALPEKNSWLDCYLPEIRQENRLFVPCGDEKKNVIPDGIRANDFLVDDYTKNLNEWEPPARGIKLLNGINHTNGTWTHDRIRFDRDAKELGESIVAVMKNQINIYDEKIQIENKEKAVYEEAATKDSFLSM